MIFEYLQHLQQILPPPKILGRTPNSQDWDDVESWTGRLPADYKKFCNVYGTGTVDFFLWFVTPVDGAFREFATKQLDALRTLKRQFPYQYSMPLFPDKDGFLPFGGTDNGDLVLWDTGKDDPDNWTIVVISSRDSICHKYDNNFVGFLTTILEKDTVCPAFPGDFPDPEFEFTNGIAQ